MIQMSRVWAMPTSDTFDCPPIGEFVRKYLRESKVSVDPFARNKRWATYTNDLNPATTAEHHLDAGEFLAKLAERSVKADLVLVDPPYSPRQVKECYDAIGKAMRTEDGWTAAMHKRWREAILLICAPGATVLTFGWGSNGMGKGLGFDITEIMLVCHGADHNDTICMAERLIAEQGKLAL